MARMRSSRPCCSPSASWTRDLRWTGGRTHLVSLGDLLDRGADSRKVMDLLMRLQGEAAAAGGQVHVVLGNHEAMNVLGDLRYVDPGEYAAFAGEEPPGQRDALRSDWVARNGADSAAAFDAKFPPGFFGHRAAFAPDGRYGRWLLGLPVAIVVNDTVFMHGGPSKVLAGLAVQDINLRYRAALRDYLATLAPLETAQLVQPEDPYAERPALAQQRLATMTTADEVSLARLKDAVEKFTAADRNPLIEPDGPNWYRGAALCNECSEADVLDPFLAGIGARRLVIGHTVARHTRVASRFDGRVVKLDAGMNRAAYRGRPAALILEQGGARVVVCRRPGAARGDPCGTALRRLPFARRCPRNGDPRQRFRHRRRATLARVSSKSRSSTAARRYRRSSAPRPATTHGGNSPPIASTGCCDSGSSRRRSSARSRDNAACCRRDRIAP